MTLVTGSVSGQSFAVNATHTKFSSKPAVPEGERPTIVLNILSFERSLLCLSFS
jgi:hypothetical protein